MAPELKDKEEPVINPLQETFHKEGRVKLPKHKQVGISEEG